MKKLFGGKKRSHNTNEVDDFVARVEGPSLKFDVETLDEQMNKAMEDKKLTKVLPPPPSPSVSSPQQPKKHSAPPGIILSSIQTASVEEIKPTAQKRAASEIPLTENNRAVPKLGIDQLKNELDHSGDSAKKKKPKKPKRLRNQGDEGVVHEEIGTITEAVVSPPTPKQANLLSPAPTPRQVPLPSPKLPQSPRPSAELPPSNVLIPTSPSTVAPVVEAKARKTSANPTAGINQSHAVEFAPVPLVLLAPEAKATLVSPAQTVVVPPTPRQVPVPAPKLPQSPRPSAELPPSNVVTTTASAITPNLEVKTRKTNVNPAVLPEAPFPVPQVSQMEQDKALEHAKVVLEQHEAEKRKMKSEKKTLSVKNLFWSSTPDELTDEEIRLSMIQKPVFVSKEPVDPPSVQVSEKKKKKLTAKERRAMQKKLTASDKDKLIPQPSQVSAELAQVSVPVAVTASQEKIPSPVLDNKHSSTISQGREIPALPAIPDLPPRSPTQAYKRVSEMALVANSPTILAPTGATNSSVRRHSNISDLEPPAKVKVGVDAALDLLTPSQKTLNKAKQKEKPTIEPLNSTKKSNNKVKHASTNSDAAELKILEPGIDNTPKQAADLEGDLARIRGAESKVGKGNPHANKVKEEFQKNDKFRMSFWQKKHKEEDVLPTKKNNRQSLALLKKNKAELGRETTTSFRKKGNRQLENVKEEYQKADKFRASFWVKKSSKKSEIEKPVDLNLIF